MPLDRHPPRRLCALLGQALPALGLHLVAWLVTTHPAAAQPFTRTIANGETVVVPREQGYGLPASAVSLKSLPIAIASTSS